jgi:hypothetical protein
MPESGFGDWDVESLRLSIFHQVGSATSQQAELWQKVTGYEPESISSQPQNRVTRATGRIGENNLLLATQDQRIDWLIRPIVGPNQQPAPVSTLRGVESTSPILQKAMRCSLETIPVVLRLAFAPTLVRQVPDSKEGLRQLSRCLPRVDLNSIEAVDFVYQVNRRRFSQSVSHIQINRLARWSTEHIEGVEIEMAPSEQPRLRPIEDVLTRKLNLDINTAPGTNAMANDRIPSLFDELMALASELAIEGDVS